MAKSQSLSKRMEKDPAVRNGVYVGAAMGILTVLGSLAIPARESGSMVGYSGGEKVAYGVVGGLVNTAMFGAIAYGATKVFSGK